MFCAILGQDIRLAFTGPLVLWFLKYPHLVHLLLLSRTVVVGGELPGMSNQVNRRQGTWADSEVEKALKSILSFAKAFRGNITNIKYSHQLAGYIMPLRVLSLVYTRVMIFDTCKNYVNTLNSFTSISMKSM